MDGVIGASSYDASMYESAESAHWPYKEVQMKFQGKI